MTWYGLQFGFFKPCCSHPLAQRDIKDVEKIQGGIEFQFRLATAEQDTAGTSTAPENAPGAASSGEGPMVVREKAHPAKPMSLDQALYEMELVGHDFFLFVDRDSDRPSVVYRRKGYDYGVISLELE